MVMVMGIISLVAHINLTIVLKTLVPHTAMCLAALIQTVTEQAIHPTLAHMTLTSLKEGLDLLFAK